VVFDNQTHSYFTNKEVFDNQTHSYFTNKKVFNNQTHSYFTNKKYLIIKLTATLQISNTSLFVK
jgi:hypothetical protein